MRRRDWLARGVALVILSLLGCTDAERSLGPSFARGGSRLVVSATDPEEAPQNTTLDVRVLGVGFDDGSQVRFLLSGREDPRVQTNSTTFISPVELIANITIDADAAPAFRDVEVRTAGGKTGIGTEKFTVTVLAEPLPGPNTTALFVSSSGFILGQRRGTCAFPNDAVVWDPRGQISALPLFAGGCGSTVAGITNAGTAVGSVLFNGAPRIPARWTLVDGVYIVEALPLLPDGTQPGAWGINSSGTIIAVNKAAVYTSDTGWRWLQPAAGASRCAARAINDRDQIAGSCTIDEAPVPVVWPSPVSAPVVLPATLGVTNPFVRAINNSGVMAGFATFSRSRPGAEQVRAMRWDPVGGGSWVASVLPDHGDGGSALGLDDAGRIVGSVVHRGLDRPALWDVGGALRPLEGGNGPAYAHAVTEDSRGPLIVGYFRTGSTNFPVTWRP